MEGCWSHHLKLPKEKRKYPFDFLITIIPHWLYHKWNKGKYTCVEWTIPCVFFLHFFFGNIYLFGLPLFVYEKHRHVEWLGKYRFFYHIHGELTKPCWHLQVLANIGTFVSTYLIIHVYVKATVSVDKLTKD